MAPSRTRIAIADDHPLFRDGVAHTLSGEPDLEVVGQGASAADACKLAKDLLPDILLIDLGMPGGGLAAIAAITAACPVTRVLVLTVSEAEDDVLGAFRAGASAYVAKGVSARHLINIVRAVSRGETYVTPALAAGLLREMARPGHDRAPDALLDDLTERERDILELLASGATNREIGQRLGLSEKTIKHYVTNILQKLQVRNRVEAALLARQIRPLDGGDRPPG